MDKATLHCQQARVLLFVPLQLTAIVQLTTLGNASPHLKSQFQQRLDWGDFVNKHKDKPFFWHHLHMMYNLFCKLLKQLTEHLDTTNNAIGGSKGHEISIELYLYATIRYLAGGCYSDICLFCGISIARFYHIVWQSILAINDAI